MHQCRETQRLYDKHCEVINHRSWEHRPIRSTCNLCTIGAKRTWIQRHCQIGSLLIAAGQNGKKHLSFNQGRKIHFWRVFSFPRRLLVLWHMQSLRNDTLFFPRVGVRPGFRHQMIQVENPWHRAACSSCSEAVWIPRSTSHGSRSQDWKKKKVVQACNLEPVVCSLAGTSDKFNQFWHFRARKKNFTAVCMHGAVKSVKTKKPWSCFFCEQQTEKNLIVPPPNFPFKKKKKINPRNHYWRIWGGGTVFRDTEKTVSAWFYSHHAHSLLSEDQSRRVPRQICK